MKTVTTADGYVFTQQPDGTWLSATSDVYDYPPDHQHFYHVETGEVLLLPPGEYIPSNRLVAFGILTEATFILEGEQLTYEQLASRGWMDCPCEEAGFLGMPPVQGCGQNQLVGGSAQPAQKYGSVLKDL